MKEIVLDTETTGLSVKDGHRIVEIGCIEINNLIPTNKIFHTLINPERDMPKEAFKIHGFSKEFLSSKKTSSAFIEGAVVKTIELKIKRNCKSFFFT